MAWKAPRIRFRHCAPAGQKTHKCRRPVSSALYPVWSREPQHSSSTRRRHWNIAVRASLAGWASTVTTCRCHHGSCTAVERSRPEAYPRQGEDLEPCLPPPIPTLGPVAGKRWSSVAMVREASRPGEDSAVGRPNGFTEGGTGGPAWGCLCSSLGNGQNTRPSQRAFLLAWALQWRGELVQELCQMRHEEDSCTKGQSSPAVYQGRLPHANCCNWYSGAFPESTNGNNYILVVGDYFTRWVEAYAICNQEAVTVANKLTNEFFFRFSPAEQLHSDQERQFESQVIAEVCKLLGIHKSCTTPYHPQSDGMVERFNRTLLNMLATTAERHPFDPYVWLTTLVCTPQLGIPPFFWCMVAKFECRLILCLALQPLIRHLLQNMQMTSASGWRKPINKCENKWAISWIGRKNYMTGRSMASCLKQEILCGCFLLWSLVDVLKSSIVPGQDPSKLSVDSQMLPIVFKMSSHAAIV